MKIMFHDNALSYRGTTIALYDYAYYNKHILGNESVIVFNRNDRNTSLDVVDKFKKEFDVFCYDNFEESNYLAETTKCDKMYIIKSGERNHQISKYCDTLVHSVFPQNINQSHGNVYAFVSEWLSDVCSNGKIPFVPHMINLCDSNDDLRKDLNISKDSIVFGRYGGYETFDIQFVKNCISKAISQKNVYFLFMNTEKFIDHERVIFLNASSDLTYKTKFINTCDAMIHARIQGESFGIAVLEFATRNKQIITYGKSNEQSHLQYLNGNCLVYNNERELDIIFNNFDKINKFDTSYLVDKFSPKEVMNKFSQVFLGQI